MKQVHIFTAAKRADWNAIAIRIAEAKGYNQKPTDDNWDETHDDHDVFFFRKSQTDECIKIVMRQQVTDLVVGQRSKFIEHAATIKDLDSLMEFTEGTFFKEGTEDVESKTERVIQKQHGWMFAGNSMETEYAGESGKTAMAEVKQRETDGRLVWVIMEELTPRTMDFDQMCKL